jgi:SAM-dependent methyltransferase
MQPTSTSASEKTPAAAPAAPDWHARYAQGDTPWDLHSTTHALDRVLHEWQIPAGRVLEMGCGTGTSAIHLARLGFEVTAFDLVPQAIDQARTKATHAGVAIDFRAADFRALSNLQAPFPFLFDCGFYHCVRRGVLPELLAFLESVTQPGSLWLTLTGNANDPHPPDKGPPRVHASVLCTELEPLFAPVELRETHFQPTSTDSGPHPLAWSALLRRR